MLLFFIGLLMGWWLHGAAIVAVIIRRFVTGGPCICGGTKEIHVTANLVRRCPHC